jgi:hypothetical protein
MTEPVPPATVDAMDHPDAAAPDDARGRGWLVAPVIAAIPAVLVAFVAILGDRFYAPLVSTTLGLGIPVIVPFLALYVGAIVLVTWLAIRVPNPWVARIVAVVWLAPGLYLAILLPAIVLIRASLG